MDTSFFIKKPRDGQDAADLYKKLSRFYSAHSGENEEACRENEYRVVPAEVFGLTDDEQAVKIPFYDGFVLSEVQHTSIILSAVTSISEWYVQILNKKRAGLADCVIHGDLHLSNIIVQPSSKRIILIDALSKPVEAGFVCVDLLTLATSIQIHSFSEPERSDELCSYLFAHVQNQSNFRFRFSPVLLAWLHLQYRFIVSKKTFREKKAASKALFRSLKIWLRSLKS